MTADKAMMYVNVGFKQFVISVDSFMEQPIFETVDDIPLMCCN